MNGHDEDRNGVTMHEADDELMRAARSLGKGIAPARDLWPGIAEAIRNPATAEAAPQGGGWPRYFAYAAAIVLLVGGSSGITWLAMHEAQPVYVAEQRVEPLRLQPVSGNFGGTHELGPEFMEARESLALQLEAKLNRLSPQARAEVERNIAEIRAAIQQINRVLADEPDNALLQELLLAAYRDELYMMRRVDGLISTVMRREDI
jgi:hypothetical protein